MATRRGRGVSCLHFAEYMDDVTELVALVGERVPGVPRVLFGHSFGGLVAATAAIADPARWQRLVLSSPFFGVGLPVPAAQRLAGKFVSKLVPSVGMPSGLHGRTSPTTARARAYDEDPLVFKNANSRWFTETEAAQAAAMDARRAHSCPSTWSSGRATES